MSRKYRILAAALALCVCSVFSLPEPIKAQEPEKAAQEQGEESEREEESAQEEAEKKQTPQIRLPEGMHFASEEESEAGEEKNAEEGSAEEETTAEGSEDEEKESEAGKDAKESEEASAEDDDPGRGRLNGDVPAEFYGPDTYGIMSIASSSSYGTVHDSRFNGYTIKKGIDVSKWNGPEGGHSHINWSKVKSSGISFAFVRAGYRGTAKKGTLAADPDRDYNLKNAAAAGLDVGAYIFSQAITTNEAVQEANYILSLVKGYKITLPLVFDYEYYKGGRLDSSTKLTNRQRTDICLAFCRTVAAAGYTPMVYANYSMLKDDLYASEISAKYPIWIARYNSKTGYSGAYDFWQYSDVGSVSGIGGKVDMNYWYVKPGSSVSFGNAAAAAPTEPAEAPGKTTISAAAASFDAVNLSWIKVPEADGYVIYRYDSGSYKSIKTITSGNTVSYSDGSRNASTTYKYQIKAYVNDGGGKVYGAVSNTASAKTSGSQTGRVNGTSVAVRSGPSASKSKIATMGPSDAATLTGSSGSWYRVSVKVKGKKKTGYISKDYVTIIKKPTLKGSAKSKSKIKLTWNKISGASGYVIQRYKGKKWKTVKTVTKGSTVSYTNSGLKKNTTYKYRIRSYKKVRGRKIYSSYTSAKKIKTKKK